MTRRPSPDPAARGRAAPQVTPLRILLNGRVMATLDTARTRLLAAGVVFTLAFLVIAGRLVELTLLTEGNEPRLVENRPAERLETGRADIVDRNGVVLATTLPAAALYANPRHLRDPKQVAERLAKVLPDLSAGWLYGKLTQDRSFVWIKRQLTPRQQQQVNALGEPGLSFQRAERRYYPHGGLTAHLTGFTSVDNQGLAGLEQYFDASLRSSAQPLQLSLDLRVQHILAEELHGAMQTFGAIGAAGVVLDAESGEILAMTSLPSFDPNRPGGAPKEERFNRATLGTYEMGSVFKLFTTAMALDSGAVTLTDGYDTTTPIRVARFVIRDFKPKNRWLSIPEILMYSSNIGTVHMAMEVGTEGQQDFLSRIGLMRRAPIELNEVGQPLLPARWRPINSMTISYGHGISVNPLQLTSAVAAIVNGGTLLPATLVKRDGAKAEGTRVIREETSAQMRRLMRLVVQAGTGRKADAVGYRVGGKSGTAEKLINGRYARNSRIASFVGAFPMDRPRYVVFAMVDEPKGRKETHGYATGGWVAAPVVGRVVARMAPLLGLQPVEQQEQQQDIQQLLVRAQAGPGTLR